MESGMVNLKISTKKSLSELKQDLGGISFDAVVNVLISEYRGNRQ